MSARCLHYRLVCKFLRKQSSPFNIQWIYPHTRDECFENFFKQSMIFLCDHDAQLITLSWTFGCDLLSLYRLVEVSLTDFIDIWQRDRLKRGQMAWLIRSGALLATLAAAIEASHILATPISIAARSGAFIAHFQIWLFGFTFSLKQLLADAHFLSENWKTLKPNFSFEVSRIKKRDLKPHTTVDDWLCGTDKFQ